MSTRTDAVGRILDDGEINCLSPVIIGPRCRVGQCPWRDHAAHRLTPPDDQRWATAIADACETLTDEQERAAARKLADGWRRSGAELVEVVRMLAG